MMLPDYQKCIIYLAKSGFFFKENTMVVCVNNCYGFLTVFIHVSWS